VGVPLAVCVALKFPAPQGAAPVVLHVQFTPPFPESPVTVAVTIAIEPSTMFAGGGVDNVTAIPETTLTFADALFVISVTEVAVIFTVSTPTGAVNVVGVPLAVWVALKLAAPHATAPVVLHVQLTPAFALSPVTVAVTIAIAPSDICAGGGVESVTRTPKGAIAGLLLLQPAKHSASITTRARHRVLRFIAALLRFRS
jgi:hypothetical protein